MEENDLRGMLLNRLVFAMMEAGVTDLNSMKAKLTVILADYKIEPKEEAMIVWTEGKNEYYLKRFLLAKAVAGCTKKTVKCYQDYLNRFFSSLAKDADTITAVEIQGYLAQALSRSSAANADNIRRVLSSFYGWCQREELILKNPMNKVESIKVRKKKKHALTDLECEQLRDACRNTRDKAIVDVLLSTACRVSELVSIKISDIEGNKIEILGKGAKYRSVYLNAKAQISIKNYLDERKDTNPYLFPMMNPECRSKEKFHALRKMTEWYRNPDYVAPLESMDQGTVEAVVRKLGQKCGIENVHPHRLRRTCATAALKRGMPIEQVSKMLGHENISTTQIYLDLDEETLAQAHGKYVT